MRNWTKKQKQWGKKWSYARKPYVDHLMRSENKPLKSNLYNEFYTIVNLQDKIWALQPTSLIERSQGARDFIHAVMRLAIHECTVHNGTEPIVLQKNSKQMSNMRVWFGFSQHHCLWRKIKNTNKYISKFNNITLEPTSNCDVTHLFWLKFIWNSTIEFIWTREHMLKLWWVEKYLIKKERHNCLHATY